jgi:hypothetical protein
MLIFLTKIAQINPDTKVYIDDLEKTNKLYQLSNYSPLISYFKQYYYEELQVMKDEGDE